MKYQVLFSLENKKINFRMSFATNLFSTFRLKGTIGQSPLSDVTRKDNSRTGITRVTGLALGSVYIFKLIQILHIVKEQRPKTISDLEKGHNCQNLTQSLFIHNLKAEYLS